MQIANSLEKTLMLGKIEGRRRRGWQNGWQHWLSGHEFEQTPGDGKGQGSLACSSPWGCKESDTTEVTEQQHRLNSERCTLHLLQEIHYPQQLNQWETIIALNFHFSPIDFHSKQIPPNFLLFLQNNFCLSVLPVAFVIYSLLVMNCSFSAISK